MNDETPSEMPAPELGVIDDALRQLGAEVDAALRSGAMRCGPYTLLHVIGEGGFGVVYAASQGGAVRREVAIKIIKPGLASGDVLRRFALEQRALARIQHECVATILDAGMSDDGRPWFAMPLLAGEPLVAGCDRALLTIEERLEVFASACDGVHAAHVHGIVHRDLKPANILLVPGASGAYAPKVIDFGIAKAIDATEGITAPQDRRRLGTPAFMAPEQLQDGADGADIRSDVYSLGMILAELVTGVGTPRRPTAVGTELSHVEMPSEAMDRVRRKDRAAADRAARDRGLETSMVLLRRLEGDIDAIVTKAIQPDPGRRYASADALAADVRRVLQHEPVLARRQGAGYVALRFVQRNRRAAFLALAGALAILGLASAATVFAIQAQRSSSEALVGQVRADQVAAFMREMLDGIDAELLDGRDASVIVDMLAASAARLRVAIGSTDPLVACQVADAVARAFVGLEQPERALVLLQDIDSRVVRALESTSQSAERMALSHELARIRVAEGISYWELYVPGAPDSTSELWNKAMAAWRSALDLLDASGQLDDPLVAVAAIRIWTARETWPPSRDFDQFELWVTEVVDRLPDSDPAKWQFQLRRVEIDNWNGVLRNYPPLLEGFERAFGLEHPMVVRSRFRYLDFLVSAAVESRAAWMPGIPVFDDAGLRRHFERVSGLANSLLDTSIRVYGKSHTLTLQARMLALGARGFLEGPEATRSEFDALRADIIAAKGVDSPLVRRLDFTWKGITQGIQHSMWWK